MNLRLNFDPRTVMKSGLIWAQSAHVFSHSRARQNMTTCQNLRRQRVSKKKQNSEVKVRILKLTSEFFIDLKTHFSFYLTTLSISKK